jgi:hypothetical protein
MPQLRTYLRIEGELVSHVTEKVDREVELSALLDEVVRNQPISTGRLPANTRFLVRLGEREAYVLEQPPMRRVIEFHASQRSGSEPNQYRLALPYVVFVVGVEAGQITSLANFFRTSPIRSIDDQLSHSCLPNTSDDGVVCLGSVRVSGRSVGERIDALIGAFWASRFNQDLHRHPLPFSGGFRSWVSRSRSDPLAALSVQYDPTWRTVRQVTAYMVGAREADIPDSGDAEPDLSETDVVTPIPDEGLVEPGLPVPDVPAPTPEAEGGDAHASAA